MTKPIPAKPKCAIRGCKATLANPTRLDRWICEQHYRLADEAARQAWRAALHAAENTQRLDPIWPQVVANHRLAWAELLKSADARSLKKPTSNPHPPGRRRQRAAARDSHLSVALKKKMGIKAKRKRGAVALEDDERRFEVALFLLFTLVGHMGDADASRLVTLLIGPVSIDPMTTVDDGLFNLSGTAMDHRLVNRVTGRETYAERIRAKAEEVVNRGLKDEADTKIKSKEMGWLLHSMKNLAVVIANEFEPAATAQCFEELAAWGWRECLLEARSRFDKANRSNFPPNTEMLQRGASALLAHLKSLKLPS